MTLCPNYDPPWDGQLDGSKYASTNCGPAATGRAVNDATCGARNPLARRVRELMRDTSGGTNMGQAAVVARAYFAVRLEVHYRMPWAEYERERLKGRGAYIQVGYGPIRDSRFAGSQSFGGGHAMYDTPNGRIRDSLADGRRPGIHRFANEVYPRSLIRLAAGRLNIADPDMPAKLLGVGFINAAFTIDQEPSGYRVHVAPGPLDWWRVVVGKAERFIRGAQAKGFSPRCSAPAFYLWPGHKPVELVRVLEGGGKGRYIAARAPRVRVEVIP